MRDREPDVAIETSIEEPLEIVVGYRLDGDLHELATADAGRAELYRGEC